MVKYGIYYGLGLAVGGIATGLLAGWGWSVPFWILMVFCLWFFRDPEREIPGGPVAVSPADGKVVVVTSDHPGTSRISIFLNIFDVHVNRSPIGGEITNIQYKRGEFLVASKPEATAQNEQNVITVRGDGTEVVFSQIAGLIARRIICYKQPKDRVAAGERVGLIKFGSRVDITFDSQWTVTVKPGERVAAGSSVIARREKVQG